MLRVTFYVDGFIKRTYQCFNRVLWVRITENKIVFEQKDEGIKEYKLTKISELLIVHTLNN